MTCRVKSGKGEIPGIEGQVTTPGIIGATAQRQEWSKIDRAATTEKYIDQCRDFEHATVIDRQPVESLEDGCNMRILSMIYDNICKNILNTLQLKSV